MCGSRGGTGIRTPPPENHKNIGFLAILVWIPWKSQSYQASIQCWAITSTQAKRHLNDVSLAGRSWPAYSGIWILPPSSPQLKNSKKKKKKKKKKKRHSCTPSWQYFLNPRMKDSLYRYIPSGSLMVSDVNTDSGGVVVSFDVLLLRRLLSAKQLLKYKH